MKILAVNPGSTSTKIAVYEGKSEIFKKNLEHSSEKIDQYSKIIDQFSMRKEEIIRSLADCGVSLNDLSAVVGRGGLLPPLKSGAYLVNECMMSTLRSNTISEHASNLGGLIAHSIAEPLGIPAYIYDPVSVDEMADIARISGLKEIPRRSFSHVLNSRAMAMKASDKIGKKYFGLNIIVAHLGGGITLSIHQNGKMIDIMDDDEGPFSPERSGRVSCKGLVELCYSGKYNKREMLKKLRGAGGLKDYLNTHDAQEVESMIASGNEDAKVIYDAMAYQIAKGIGELATVVNGKVDIIVITGGLAYSRQLTEWIRKRVSFIAPVDVIPGENELESLAYGAMRVLKGEEIANEYNISSEVSLKD